ncbi:MAG: 6-bladed beta-propeller [Nitrosopumilaceae archaeon]|nr:6-bladed beta-propeller [Nitrosopumilaceae archaeon]NIU02487.1 6-bladed beta-propeller [Nitrosopumilaceae archaeon]NIU88948.1 6-bladed beta-propeller [Nitrosopumilaceae archaeon]NIV67059.1 6-bladed beta-propeller [Nitrosopumilaceae archaeon]NIX63088.1 6-bladed beta-propeller [Nitrosopumilaceae archaeon]
MSVKYVVILIALFVISIVFENGFASTIYLSSEKDVFGPNEWIKVFVEIDKYSGGEVQWTATKPDGTETSGSFENLQASKKTHTISRNAFDNQFGEWKIQYSYKDSTNSISVKVEDLQLGVATDKSTYYFGDTIQIKISTNYYEPKAANAELYKIEILDKNNSLAQQIDDSYLKAYQPITFHEISASDLLKYNPTGTYTVRVEYFSIEDKSSFEIKGSDTATSIFLGTDKSLYDPADVVELNIVLEELFDSELTLEIKKPSGKVTTKTIPVDRNLTRLKLDFLDTNESGTYQIKASYAGNSATKTFDVIAETLEKPSTKSLELNLSLDKDQYRPGERVTAAVEANKLLENNLYYFLENPNGERSGKYSVFNPNSGSFNINHIINRDSTQGPWKFYVKYGTIETFDIFFVAGGPVAHTSKAESKDESNPQVVLTIDSKSIELGSLSGIDTDGDGDLYLVDKKSGKIKIFDENGKLLKMWGIFGSGEGQTKNAQGIFAEANLVHVADSGNSRMQTFDHDGNLIREWGNSGLALESLKHPVSVSTDGSLYYVADSQLSKILIFDSNGDFITKINSIATAAAKFSGANDIVVTKEGDVFILVKDDNRILHYSKDGNFVRSIGSSGQNPGQFESPTAITMDNLKNIYVADSGNHRIQVLDFDGKSIAEWGSFGNGVGEFNQISGIAVDDSGFVWVADSGNSRIQKIAPAIQSSLNIPDWIKNNAGWWSENQINDDDFAKGIEFMIKNKIILIPELEHSSVSSSKKIPDWIKNNAGWWSENKITDKEFSSAIEYLVKNGIIQI